MGQLLVILGFVLFESGHCEAYSAVLEPCFFACGRDSVEVIFIFKYHINELACSCTDLLVRRLLFKVEGKNLNQVF